MDEKFYLPEKYRDRLFTFEAGGYDGCIWHPAAVLVTGEGDVALVNSDGGAGGLDEDKWYCASMRAFLDMKRVATVEGLFTEDTSGKAYREAVAYRDALAEERKNRERVKVFEALERELGKEGFRGWNHKFEEYDVSTPDKVRETCKALVNWGDKYMNAGIADALDDAGYEGAGCVCTKCDRYFEKTEDCERFSDCVDPDSYYGIGGLAVAHGVLLCDGCRDDARCPVCGDLSLTEEVTGPYAVRFMRRWVTACEGCVERFLDEHRRWRQKIEEFGADVANDKRKLEEYLKAMKEQGKTPEDLVRLNAENTAAIRKAWRENVNELRDELQDDVEDFFVGGYASDRLDDGEECDY